MALSNIDQIVEVVKGFVGESIPKSHSYTKWLAKRELTATSITATVTDGIISQSTESSGNGIWVGNVSLLARGEANLVLTLVAGDKIKKSVIKYMIEDAESI